MKRCSVCEHCRGDLLHYPGGYLWETQPDAARALAGRTLIAGKFAQDGETPYI